MSYVIRHFSLSSGDKVNDVYRKLNQSRERNDYGDGPRNKKQLLNMKQILSPSDETGAIIGFNFDYDYKFV